MVEPAESKEPKISEEPPTSDTRFKTSDRFLAILGPLAFILGLLAALITLSHRVLILWVVLAVAIIIALLPLFTPLRQWKYMTPVYAALCAGLIIGFNQYIGSHDTGPSRSNSLSTASIEISSPLPDAPVPRCVPVSGVAKLPVGDSIWVLVQGMGPPVYYLEGRAGTSPSQNPGQVIWNFGATVGSLTSSTQYNIVAIVLNPAISNYMQGMLNADTLKSNIGTLANASLLPGTLSKYIIRVQRMAGVGGNCA